MRIPRVGRRRESHSGSVTRHVIVRVLRHRPFVIACTAVVLYCLATALRVLALGHGSVVQVSVAATIGSALLVLYVRRPISALGIAFGGSLSALASLRGDFLVGVAISVVSILLCVASLFPEGRATKVESLLRSAFDLVLVPHINRSVPVVVSLVATSIASGRGLVILVTGFLCWLAWLAVEDWAPGSVALALLECVVLILAIEQRRVGDIALIVVGLVLIGIHLRRARGLNHIGWSPSLHHSDDR